MPDGTVSSNKSLSLWKKLYKQFKSYDKRKESSVVALSKRAKNDKFPTINPIVDLYNLVSVMSATPVGGYDLDMISGDIHFQYSDISREFLGIGMGEAVITDPSDIIYRDNDKTLCWLWNYRDGIRTCISESTSKAIFFMDCPDMREGMVYMPLNNALNDLSRLMKQLGGEIIQQGVLDNKQTCVSIK